MRDLYTLDEVEKEHLEAEFENAYPNLRKNYTKYIVTLLFISFILLVFAIGTLLKNGVYNAECAKIFFSSGISFIIMMIIAVADDINKIRYLNKFEEWLKTKNIKY